jgi:hypothetical protein
VNATPGFPQNARMNLDTAHCISDFRAEPYQFALRLQGTVSLGLSSTAEFSILFSSGSSIPEGMS